MCNIKRLESLHRLTYDVAHLNGALVEVGVYKGGSSMCMALSTMRHNSIKTIHLYDTFAGLTQPCNLDFKSGKDFKNTQEKWNKNRREGHNEWCYSPLEEVKKNFRKTNYPEHLVFFNKGDICELNSDKIRRDGSRKQFNLNISLLRIDVDFYEPTLASLELFYPQVEQGGIIIMDDYNCWNGAKQAYEDYIKKHDLKHNIMQIDHSAVYFLKGE